MISQVRVAAALCYRAATPDSFSVLGIPHPAVDTRDAALYMVSLVLSPTTRKQGLTCNISCQPFRNGLKAQQMVGLPTLMWNLMAREIQQAGSHIHPVRTSNGRLSVLAKSDWYDLGGERESSNGPL